MGKGKWEGKADAGKGKRHTEKRDSPLLDFPCELSIAAVKRWEGSKRPQEVGMKQTLDTTTGGLAAMDVTAQEGAAAAHSS